MAPRPISTPPDDLDPVLVFIGERWLADRPRTLVTPATLPWSIALSDPEADWADRIVRWEAGGRVVGIAWFPPDGSADVLIDPAHRATLDEAAHELHLAWAARDGAEALSRFAEVDRPDDITWLRDHGFAPIGQQYAQWHQRLSGPPSAPVVPPGYRVRSMRGPEDVPARVEVHRAAFAPSRLTDAKFLRATQQAHYAWDRDVVVEAPDGTFAAFALGWYDPVGRVGEFEPVGTHPDHRGRGLALAANQFALGRQQAAGASDVIVFSSTANAASQALYARAGFREVARHDVWSRPR